MKKKQTDLKEGSIKIRKLDMSKVDGYAISEFDMIKIALVEDKKYKRGLLYRGINARNIPKLFKTGRDNVNYSYRGIIFCCTEEEITNPYRDSAEDIFSYACGAIAVFDSNHFKKSDFEWGYVFKDPKNKLEALVAVYELNYPL